MHAVVVSNSMWYYVTILLQADSIQEIVGVGQLGDTPTSATLRAHGGTWGQHVLEGPISWIMSTAYIAGTVLAHQTPLGGLAGAALGHTLPATVKEATAGEGTLMYVVRVLDVLIYAFLPWWTTVLLRLLQRRPWLHRVSGRAVLVGDIPWVAQVRASYRRAARWMLCVCSELAGRLRFAG